MTDQHCPGFESNKSLNAVKVKCPDCGKEIEIFSDEMDKKVKCPACSAMVDPKACATA
jgi:ribosomal protein S27E